MNREGVDSEGMNIEEVNRDKMNREQQLMREIEQIKAATAEVIAEAGDLLKECEPSPSNEMAQQEVIELLGVNYVGPVSLGRLLYGDENKFQQVELDYVKLKEILNEPDEWDSSKKKFETYALVYKPPISFLELKAKANEAASAQDKTPAFSGGDWYKAQTFATEAPTSGSWELVRMATVPGSTDKAFDDQTAMIVDRPNLTPTTFPALAALLVGQYLEHGVKLYEGELHYGRTSTCAASGDPVRLGHMHATGASVHDYVHAHVLIGLAVSRNLN